MAFPDIVVRFAAILQKMKNGLSGNSCPLRGDFEVEHDNNAELAIADMDFPVDDNPLERSLKLKIIEMYNAKLDERERRKKMVQRYGLLDFQKLKADMKKRPKEYQITYVKNNSPRRRLTRRSPKSSTNPARFHSDSYKNVGFYKKSARRVAVENSLKFFLSQISQ